MDFSWKTLDALSPLAVHEMLQAREAVFVVEQNCPYQESDQYDRVAWHGIGRVDGALAAYARVLPPGGKFVLPSIGRIMTTATFRRDGYGRSLMQEAIRFAEATFPGQGVQIGAQCYLQAFYESFGFRRAGPDYDEDGIPHVDMVRDPGLSEPLHD